MPIIDKNLMSDNTFPRKVIYAHITEKPLDSRLVAARNDRTFNLNDHLRDFSDVKWATDNVGWTSSPLPTMIEVDSTEDELVLHCGITEYKYLSGMVKLAKQEKKSNTHGTIHGLTTEVIPIFEDETVIIEQRQGADTQHGVGFYDFACAGQNAKMYVDKANELVNGLVSSMFDMVGFPQYQITKAFPQLHPDSIGDMFYVAVSRGFEVSLDSQVCGFTHVPFESGDVRVNDASEHRLIYMVDELPELLDSIGRARPRGDIFARTPKPAPQTGVFTIVDDSIGTILGILYHKDRSQYQSALDALHDRGYTINEVNGPSFNLDDLN
jgi:hypothetical protein